MFKRLTLFIYIGQIKAGGVKAAGPKVGAGRGPATGGGQMKMVAGGAKGGVKGGVVKTGVAPASGVKKVAGVGVKGAAVKGAAVKGAAVKGAGAKGGGGGVVKAGVKVVPQPSSPRVIQARALYPYTAANEDELSFQEGDIIIIHHKDPQGWWEGELQGRRGWVPANYLQEL